MKTPTTAIRRSTGHALLLCSLAIATGCATLSEEQCHSTDWEALGEEDGALGYPPERIEEHRSACEEYGVVPDEAAWNRGRLAGLDQLCSTRGGLRLGQAGRSYSGACPPGYEEDFREGYSIGKRIRSVNSEIERTEEMIRLLQLELNVGRLTETQEFTIRQRLDEHNHKRLSLERDLAELEQQAQRLLSGI